MKRSGGTVLLCLLAGIAMPARTAGNQNQSEVATKDVPVTFKATTNLVMVPVVVRDGKGHPVGNLKPEDFQLFDRGKPQIISKFSVEKRDAIPAPPPQPDTTPAPESSGGLKPKLVYPESALPDHFFAYLFDDVQLKVGDLDRVRDAAARHMEKSLGPKDRAAIYTTSGQIMLDFTDDRAKLHDTLYRLLLPKPLGGGMPSCPDLSYHQARLIQNEKDREARYFGLWDTAACNHLKMPDDERVAESMLMAATGRVLALGDQQSRGGLMVLANLVRRVSIMPGQRTIVLVSPGFLAPDFKQEQSDLIDRAIRAKVVINSLDARGLNAEPPSDVSKPGGVTNIRLVDPILGQRSPGDYVRYQQQSEHETVSLQADVLAEVAAGTGGTFFHNGNDLDEGFREVAGVPEYAYILGFSPQNMKYDGSFHSLKVTLKNHSGLMLDARRGYSVPNSITDPAEIAKEEIREAIFSRDEIHDLPVELHTEYFKSGPGAAKLSVVAHVDLKPLKFRKEDGRNRDELTVVTGLFDHNGNYIASLQKNVDLRLIDGNFERWLQSGVSVRSSFDVKPGTYVIRLVVRDAGGQLMAAQNGVVEIP